MQKPASAVGHPVHPALVGLPIALWAFSLLCDLLYLGGAEAEIWSSLALYTMVGGFVAAFTAVAVPGFVAQMNVTLVVLALYALNIWLRLGDQHAGVAIALSALGVGMLAISSRLEAALLKGFLGILCVALAGGAGPADAGLLSSKGPVIAILDGELLVGEATAHLAGWGTIALRSSSNAALTCTGEFSATEALGDAGELRCSDGRRTAFRFERLSLRRGHGAGDPGGSALSFTYGLTAEESAPYLKLPAGKELRPGDGNLELVASVPFAGPK